MIVSRYFILSPEQVSGFKAILVPDNDLLTLDEIPNCKVLAETSDGKKVVHVLLGPVQLNNMKELAEVTDPLTLSAVETLGLTNCYLGETPQDVRDATGETFITTHSYTDPDTSETITYDVDHLKHEWR